MSDVHDLRAAYVRRDPDADELRRALARTLRGAAYYELVCCVAEHAWHRGEQCRAEALLRVAARISDVVDRDPSPGARLLARRAAESMRADPDVPRAIAPRTPVVDVALHFALMRFDPETLDHVAEMALADRWLLVTPVATGGGKLAARCALIVDAILAHHNRSPRGCASDAPHDPNFIGVRAIDARIIDAAEVPALAAALRRSTWSSSALYAVDGLRFAPLTPAQLIEIAGNVN